MDWNNKTWEDNELVNAQLMNDHIRDSFDFLYSPPAARVYNGSDISVSHSSATALTFDSERFDNDTIHDTVTNPSRLTCKTAGRYLITGHVSFQTANATGVRELWVRLNGATKIAGQTGPGRGSGADTPVTVGTVYELAENDYVELIAYQDSGSAAAAKAQDNWSPEFSMIRIG
jgi:hypothetical protein